MNWENGVQYSFCVFFNCILQEFYKVAFYILLKISIFFLTTSLLVALAFMYS